MKTRARQIAPRQARSCGPGTTPRHTAGFTLVELIISSALMAMILSAAYGCLSAALAARKTVETRADLVQNGRVALALMSADLRSACPLSPEFAFLGMDRRVGQVEADNLDFATYNLSHRQLEPADWCEVSYFLDRHPGSKGWALYRRRDPSPDGKPLAGGTREEITRGVKGLRFEYYDGWDWYDEWGDPEGRRTKADSWLEPANLEGMPDAVRITLWLDAEEEPSRSAAQSDQGKPAPPFMVQTVAYLNLARAPALEEAVGESAPTVSEPSAMPGGGPTPGGMP